MNTIKWLLRLSADLSDARAGSPGAQIAPAARADSRHDEAWMKVDGDNFLITNLKCPERWSSLKRWTKRSP
jgi:hypothetical protein